LMGFETIISCPEGYDPEDDVIGAAANRGGVVRIERDPARAVAGADIVVTDTWISMGQSHAEAKLAAMAPYSVTPALMAVAAPQATFLHCLPAHRGAEV